MLLKETYFLYLFLVSIFDLQSRRIPDCITIIFFSIVVFSDILLSPAKITQHLLCGFFFFLLFFCISIFTKGLGIGDAKMAGVIGYGSGLITTSFIFIFASFIGILAFLIFSLFNKRIKKLPFAPFAAFGYLLTQLCFWWFL